MLVYRIGRPQWETIGIGERVSKALRLGHTALSLCQVVQQEQHWDLPSFLKEAKSNAIQEGQIDALINHAYLYREKPKELRLFARNDVLSARTDGGDGLVLNASIDILFSSIFKSLVFFQDVPPESGPDKTKDYAFFSDQDIKQKISFKIVLRKVKQKPEEESYYWCYIAIRLKPFMRFDQQPVTMITIRRHEYAIISWYVLPGGSVGYGAEHTLPISHSDQTFNSEHPSGALGSFQPFWFQKEQARKFPGHRIERPTLPLRKSKPLGEFLKGFWHRKKS